MKKFWWKLRYVLEMAKRTSCSLRFCWEAAGSEVESNKDWSEWTPQEAVKEELSYWVD